MIEKKALEDMLAMVTPDNIHSEITTGNTVGKEMSSFETQNYLKRRTDKVTEEESLRNLRETSLATVWKTIYNDTW